MLRAADYSLKLETALSSSMHLLIYLGQTVKVDYFPSIFPISCFTTNGIMLITISPFLRNASKTAFIHFLGCITAKTGAKALNTVPNVFFA